MDSNLYLYKAKIVSVYDGDTCRADIDLGLNTWIHNEKLRLLRINAPEIRGEERQAGLSARDFLRELISGKEVIIQTVKDRKGKYGRYLAEIWVEQEEGIWVNVNDLMVTDGFAEYKAY
jgi:micrococcal nuclease